MNGLKGKRVFVTGAAGGIGRAAAERFYAEGSDLVLIDMPSAAEAELDEQFPERMTYIQADITKKEDLARIEAEMDKGLDVLINNAGITRDAQMIKMEDEAWDDVIAVNLTSIFHLCRMAARRLKDKGSGSIINTASVVAHQGNFGQTNYVASKAGLIGMTKSLAKEVGKYGVRVNSVAPGFVETKLMRKMPEKVTEMLSSRAALRRIGKPEEIAAAFAFLASDESSFITGTCINVDGGF